MVGKIIIADDHALLRQALCQVLLDHDDNREVLEAADLDSVLELLRSDDDILLLIDLGMPGMNGAESLRALREAYPAAKVAVLTGVDDRGTILECLGAGVHGYVLKASPMDEIFQAIETIVAGGVHVTSAIASRPGPLAMEASTGAPTYEHYTERQSPAPVPRLTARQTEVLRLLAQGHATKEIARRLDLGPGTVKIHLAAIFRLLNVRNRTEAALIASKLNL